MLYDEILSELLDGNRKIIDLLTTGQKAKQEDAVLDGFDVMQKYHISKRTLGNWKSDGLIYHKVGNKIYYYQSDIDSFIKK